MKTIFIRFALWLLEKCGHELPKPVTVAANLFEEFSSLIGIVKPMAAEQDEKWPDRSGEAKKHAVYANLIKKLPEVAKRDISLAIELALRK